MILTVTLNPALDWNVLVERLRLEEKNPALDSYVVPGGKGLNVSRVLTRLGVPNRAFVVVGGDSGRRLLWLAKLEGVRIAPFAIRGETRINLTLAQRKSPAQIRINQPGPSLSAAEIRRLDGALRREIRKADIVVFSGSLPPGLPPSRLASWLRLARRLGKKTVVDSDGAVLKAAASTPVWLLKPNRAEWKSIGRRAPRAEWVLLSKSAQGAELIGRKFRLAGRLAPQRALCTVGAGDSLLAGFLAGLGRKLPERAALRFGLAAGSASARNPPGVLADAHGVEKFFR